MYEKQSGGIIFLLDRCKPRIVVTPVGMFPLVLEEIAFPYIRPIVLRENSKLIHRTMNLVAGFLRCRDIRFVAPHSRRKVLRLISASACPRRSRFEAHQLSANAAGCAEAENQENQRDRLMGQSTGIEEAPGQAPETDSYKNPSHASRATHPGQDTVSRPASAKKD